MGALYQEIRDVSFHFNGCIAFLTTVQNINSQVTSQVISKSRVINWSSDRASSQQFLAGSPRIRLKWGVSKMVDFGSAGSAPRSSMANSASEITVLLHCVYWQSWNYWVVALCVLTERERETPCSLNWFCEGYLTQLSNNIKKGWCPTGAQGSPSELNILRLGGIEPRNLRLPQILS
jgi:hypothetical protein